MGRKQRGYPVKVKLAAIGLVEIVGLPTAVEHLGYPHSTVHRWWQARAKLRAFKGNKLSKTTKGQGRKESFPFTPALITFMKDIRRDEDDSFSFIQEHYEEWYQGYAATKKSEQSCRRSLERLLQRTAARYGVSTQKPQETKLPSGDLERIKTDFALRFWEKYGDYGASEIYNVDETAIQFDMPPSKIWGIKGRKGSAKVQDLNKHCGRMTAVLTIRADGKKLPILFILRGKVGGFDRL
ncbi:hypothetical protein PR001_g17315 [Phytophthora rubi]|uniref:DDE-1 domain-containing protein n=1 Tax=Phytophthora rubi TaxID=129364 RepID=A0A6A3KEZ7_9STRA|nr:hypothetical protein PR001_g17315 [Phytophthora rubi]